MRILMNLLHTLIIGLYPFYSVLEFNWNYVSPQEVLSALPAGLGVLALILLLWRALTPSFLQAGIGCTLTYFLLLAYGPLARVWRRDENVPGAGLVDLAFHPAELLPLCLFVVVTVLLAIGLRHMKIESLRGVAKMLNYFAVVLLLASGLPIFAAWFHESHLTFPKVPVIDSVQLRAEKHLPDIYYIILDGFARKDVLERNYEMEPPFLSDELSARGFYVADKSNSNYFRTNYSLTSSLNMSFIEPPVVPEGLSTMLFPYLRHRIQDNAVRSILEGAGYRTVVFETGYRATEWRDVPDYQDLTNWNNVIATTASYLQLPWIREYISYQLHSLHRERMERTFAVVEKKAAEPGPKFVFLHILAPHPPFVYQSDGSLYTSRKVFTLGDGDHYGGARDYKERYSDEVKYITLRTAAMVDVIRQNDPQAYIIIQGDHGPGSRFDIRSLAASDPRERFAILNSYFFPDRRYDTLYPEITPVNSFRVVMNKIASSALPLLPDRSFFAEISKPLDFKEVTEILQQEK